MPNAYFAQMKNLQIMELRGAESMTAQLDALNRKDSKNGGEITLTLDKDKADALVKALENPKPKGETEELTIVEHNGDKKPIRSYKLGAVSCSASYRPSDNASTKSVKVVCDSVKIG